MPVLTMIVTAICLLAIGGTCWYVNVYQHRNCCGKKAPR